MYNSIIFISMHDQHRYFNLNRIKNSTHMVLATSVILNEFIAFQWHIQNKYTNTINTLNACKKYSEVNIFLVARTEEN